MADKVVFKEQSFLETDVGVTIGNWFELSISEKLFSQFSHEGKIALSMVLEGSLSSPGPASVVIRIRKSDAIIYDEIITIGTQTEIKFIVDIDTFHKSTFFYFEVNPADMSMRSRELAKEPCSQVLRIRQLELKDASTWMKSGELLISLAEVAVNKLEVDADKTLSKVTTIADSIARALDLGTGFSLIRLGDGEGRVLGYRSAFNEYHILDGVLNYQYGAGSIGLMMQRNPENWIHLAALDLQEKLQTAIAHSSALAIPGQNWLVEGAPFMGRYASAISVLDGIRLFQGESTQIFETHFLREKKVSDVFFNQCFQQARRIVQLGSADAANHLSEAYNLDSSQISFIKTMPHATFPIGNVEDFGLYPDHYLEIEKTIASYGDLRGSMFLVGAGILGKWFCELIRRQGGVGLDVGSLYDKWLGAGRPEALS
jgi:hypothetical protein